MSNIIYDDNLVIAQQHGVQRTILPFSAAGDQTSAIYELDYFQLTASFTPLPANSLHPTIPACYLIEETPLVPTEVGGVSRWTRRYATIPITRNEGGSIAYQFVGIYGAVGIPTASVTKQRVPTTWTTKCRIQYQYYLVGLPSSILTFQAIPTTLKQHYYIPLIEGQHFSFNQGTDTNYVWTSISAFPTVPTAETYLSLVAAGAEIQAEDSTVKRWRGNIYEVQSKFVVAL